MKIFFASKSDLEALDIIKRQLIVMFDEPNNDYDQPVIMVAQEESGQVYYGDIVYDIDVNGPMFATDDFNSVKVTLLATTDKLQSINV